MITPTDVPQGTSVFKYLQEINVEVLPIILYDIPKTNTGGFVCEKITGH